MRHHLIRKLQQKKYREETGLFLVEGETSVIEALRAAAAADPGAGAGSPFEPKYLLATDDFLARHQKLVAGIEADAASREELAKLGSLASNDAAILVLKRPQEVDASALLDRALAENSWLLLADGINDPGNLGTLIRIADWYGLAGIVTAPGSVDRYNPKTVSASKGSFLRVPVACSDLSALLRDARQRGVPVYAATMDGAPLHGLDSASPGLLVMGSETHGISPGLLADSDTRLTIPRFGGAESLNVAIAAGIILDSFRRLAR
jgi:TrmH family RNA methyltransferase